MPNDVYKTVDGCHQRAKRRALMEYQLYQTLFRPTGQLEFIPVSILGSLPKTTNGGQSVIIITDGYSNLAWVIVITKTSTSYVVRILFDYWMIP